MSNRKTSKILGVKVDFNLSMSDVMSEIENMLDEKNKSHLICTTNSEFIMDAQDDPKFKSIINNSDLSIPDGVGVLFANHFLENTKNIKSPIMKLFWGLGFGISSFFVDYKIGEKISGVDLATEILKKSATTNYSVFLLGGRPKDFWGRDIVPAPFDMAKLTAEKIKEKFPQVNIIGATSEFSRNPSDDEATIKYIKDCMRDHDVKNLDFLFVAYNHKYQENWYIRNAEKIPATIGLGLGGTFDYLSGYLKRPTSYKFEWLKKIFIRPTKISRILRAFPLFPIRVFIDSLKK